MSRREISTPSFGQIMEKFLQFIKVEIKLSMLMNVYITPFCYLNHKGIIRLISQVNIYFQKTFWVIKNLKAVWFALNADFEHKLISTLFPAKPVFSKFLFSSIFWTRAKMVVDFQSCCCLNYFICIQLNINAVFLKFLPKILKEGTSRSIIAFPTNPT